MSFSQKLKFWESRLFEIRRPPFKALAFLTFRHILDLAVLKNGLHLDLSAAGTEEFLGCAGGTRVFTGYSHNFSPCRQAFMIYQEDTTEWILSQAAGRLKPGPAPAILLLTTGLTDRGRKFRNLTTNFTNHTN
jgi:hypothetical protein